MSEKTTEAEQPDKRRRWVRIMIMFMTMGYVFPHALME